jgi:Raf kinase inhibitor-like YbhB/YbcL family protein
MKPGFLDLVAAGGFATVALLSGPSVRAAEPFTLSSSAYQDNAMLNVKNAGNLKDMPSCPGDAGNVSPPLAWANAPDTAKSFALTIVDPEGGGGAGFIHMVVYGIPASVTGFAEGELSKPSDKFIGGKNAKDMATYFGPCPPAAFGVHHYAYILIATDLDPKAPELKPGMTRDELLAVLKGHAKGTAGLVLRFKHP